ncbi:MAG: tyrosine--tRNA ligase [Candidatus Omnitrophica bacterium]|nr:tyrosine--tRNA ligase [Candidatus Omnitrophota bacterium]
MSSIKQIITDLSRGTTEIINTELLEAKLRRSQETGKPLHIKAGFDPTAPDIHLGHSVLLRKMRQFQELGHKVFFLIGDFTALIGDPTGKNQLRPRLEPAFIEENAKTYAKQVFKILDPKKTEVVFNSHWLGKMTPQDLVALTAQSTVAQMLVRSDFKKRFDAGREISVLEFIYPLLQGYDSVAMKADVELGGSDQKFNLLMGRQIQQAYGQEPQVVMMTPLLEGLDGENKMSKSLNNYVGINEQPSEIFGKIMSISDELMFKYAECLTSLNLDELHQMHPKEAKMKLAETIVVQYYDAHAGQAAREAFERVFAKGENPEDMTEFSLAQAKTGLSLAELLVDLKLVGSRNEVRRLMQQGGISVNNEKITDEKWPLRPGIIKVGKRRFLKIS